MNAATAMLARKQREAWERENALRDRLIEFAQKTLTIMEAQQEWSSDTLDDVSTVAFNLGLADNSGPDQTFKRKRGA